MNLPYGFENSCRGRPKIHLTNLLCILGGIEFENLESRVPRCYELKFISTWGGLWWFRWYTTQISPSGPLGGQRLTALTPIRNCMQPKGAALP